MRSTNASSFARERGHIHFRVAVSRPLRCNAVASELTVTGGGNRSCSAAAQSGRGLVMTKPLLTWIAGRTTGSALCDPKRDEPFAFVAGDKHGDRLASHPFSLINAARHVGRQLHGA